MSDPVAQKRQVRLVSEVASTYVSILNATGRMVAGVLASLAELQLELGRERRAVAREARRARGQAIGRPKVLEPQKSLWRSGYTLAVNQQPPSWQRGV